MLSSFVLVFERVGPLPMMIHGARRVVCAALLVLMSARGAEVVGQQTAPEPAGFAWKSRYADALEAARKHQLLVAVYFRPVVGIEPRPLRFAAKTKNLGRLVSGVRVGAAEVVELKERFRVTSFPALVVLDARERVLMHWLGNIPADVWSRVARTSRQLKEQHAEEEKDLEAARALLDSGQTDLAYGRLSPLLRSRRTALQVLRAAKELEARMIMAGEERILLVLAAEGLIPDARLKERLRELFAEAIPPPLKKARDRELRRLETMTIGGRRAR